MDGGFLGPSITLIPLASLSLAAIDGGGGPGELHRGRESLPELSVGHGQRPSALRSAAPHVWTFGGAGLLSLYTDPPPPAKNVEPVRFRKQTTVLNTVSSYPCTETQDETQ